MREQLRQRLEELKREFETGQTRLRELELQEARLRETLLRISGAIQVLEEIESVEAGGDDDPAQGSKAAEASAAP